MQRGVAERSKVDESGVAISRLQREGEVDSDGGGSAAALGVDNGEDFAARAFFLNAALGGGEAHKGFEKIGSGGGALDELAGSGAHGAYDDLWLIEASDGKYGGVRKFLMKKLDGVHGRSGIIRGNVNEQDIGMGSLYAAHDGIGRGNGETGTGMNRAGHTGAIDQHLEHGALLIVRGHDDD